MSSKVWHAKGRAVWRLQRADAKVRARTVMGPLEEWIAASGMVGDHLQRANLDSMHHLTYACWRPQDHPLRGFPRCISGRATRRGPPRSSQSGAPPPPPARESPPRILPACSKLTSGGRGE